MQVRAPIVGLTGNALAEDIREFKRHGAEEVLTKPLDTELLAGVMKQFFHLNSDLNGRWVELQ